MAGDVIAGMTLLMGGKSERAPFVIILPGSSSSLLWREEGLRLLLRASDQIRGNVSRGDGFQSG